MSSINWDSATNFAIKKTMLYAKNDENITKLISSVFSNDGSKTLMEEIVTKCRSATDSSITGMVLMVSIINIIVLSMKEIRALASTANMLINVNNDGIKFIVYGILNCVLYILIGENVDELDQMFDVCWTTANFNPKEFIANTKSCFSKCFSCCSSSSTAVKNQPTQ